MAGETYAYNFLNENLANLALESKVSEKVLWVNSDFENESLKNVCEKILLRDLKNIQIYLIIYL